MGIHETKPQKGIFFFFFFFERYGVGGGSGLLMPRKIEGQSGCGEEEKWGERGVIAERIERVGLHLMVAETDVIAPHAL